MIDDKRIGELERLSTVATVGPWTNGRSFESVIAPSATSVDAERREDAKHYGGVLIAESIFGAGDLAFIAEAREALPALVADARRYREALREIRSRCAATSNANKFAHKLADVASEALDPVVDATTKRRA